MEATSSHIQLRGRAAQHTAIQRWIDHGQSPLWVVGSPGVGKTALVAASFARRDAVWCALQGEQDHASICAALVLALGLGQVQDPVAQINAALSGPDAPWLICDDATQCMAALDAFLAQLDQDAARRVVMTTQHHKASAHVLHVPPLAHEDALELFITLVSDVLPGWDAEVEAVAQLVGQLGGVPLVLELAARHMSLMSASDMSLALINDGAPFGQALESSMSLAWGALPEDARKLMMCCAIVDGPMDLSCIRALCEGQVQAPEALVLTLIERSLICVRVGGQRRQFDMPGGVLHFARHQARQHPELTHPARLIAWARQQLKSWRAAARGPQGLEAIDAHRALTVTIKKTIRLAQQHNQPRDALEMLLDHLELATDVALNQALQQLESSRGAWSSPGALMARHHLEVARVLIALGRLQEARAILIKGKPLCEASPAQYVQWGLRWSLMCRDKGDVEAAIEALKALVDEVDLQSQPVDAIELYSALGLLLLNTARFGREDAQARLEQSTFYLEAALKLVHHTNLSVAVACRDAHALCLHERGRTRQGQILLEALIDDLERAKVEAPLINVLSHASALAYFAGDFIAARRLVQKSLILCQRRGHLGRYARQMSSDGVFASAAGQLDEAERVLLLAEAECARRGQKMSQLVAISQLVMLYAEREQVVDARRWSEIGLSLARALNAHGHQGLILLWGAIIGAFDSPEARLAQVEEGARLLSTALEYQVPAEAPRWAQLKLMCEHRVALMQAEVYLNHHQLHQAHQLMERVQHHLTTLTTEADPLLLVMSRQLKLASARLMSQHTIPAELVDVRSLIVGPNGLWFEVEGKRVSLAQRETLRRLFVALIDHWRPAPESSTGLDVEALINIGWPGEVLEHQSAINRVYASIRLLRKLGLKDVLLTEDGGYLIDEMVHVVRVAS